MYTYRRGKPVKEGKCSGVACSTWHYTVTDFVKDTYEDVETNSVSVSVSTTCNLDTEGSNLLGVDSSTAESGKETRPANMKVIYIIRVY